MLEDIFGAWNGEDTHWMIVSELFLSLIQQVFEMKVGSSMIQELQTAFVSLQHTLQHSPFSLLQILCLLEWKLLNPFE